jgi:hypothetical protein
MLILTANIRIIPESPNKNQTKSSIIAHYMNNVHLLIIKRGGRRNRRLRISWVSLLHIQWYGYCYL